MKKYFLLIISLISLQIQAMVDEQVTFDFRDLSSLNITPPLTEPQINLIKADNGVRLQANDRVFTAGPITLDFTQAPNSPGAGFSHYGDNYSLTIGKFTAINFAATGGCVLKSIVFNRVSDIYLPEGQPGRMVSTTRTWSAEGNDVTSVTLKKGGQDSQMDYITVTYQRPSTPLNFLSSSPASGSESVGTFKTMTLSFSSSVTKTNNASSIKLTGKDVDNAEINQVMNVTSLGSTVTLTAPTPITKDASLKVSISAGTFENSEGATNLNAIDISFTLKAKRDIFNPISIEPEAGTVGELPQEIRLTFNNFAKKGTGVVKFKQQDGTESFPATYEIDANDAKVGIIKHTNGRIVDASTWIVEIPEGVFHNQYYGVDEVEDRWNEAKTLTYVIDGSQAGPQDSPTMKAAKELLKLTGAGYPSTESATYKALDNLVKAEETPDEAVLQAAIDALYNETTVVMPNEGDWYFIAGVNKSGKKLYLGFDAESDKTKLVEAENNATAFKVTKATGSVIVFETKDGRFLHVPSALPNYGKTSTGSNLTDEQSDLNNLTLTKFKAADVTETETSPLELYGKLTIQGQLDKNEDDGTTPTVYARFSYDGEGRISTTASPVALAFTDAKSNAFILVKTDEPVEYVDIIYPRVGFRPDAIDKAGDDMKLIVYGPSSTKIADASLIYFTKCTEGEDNNEKVNFTGTILTPTDVANTFSVNTTGLNSGMYNLVMVEGAFEFTAPEGKTIKNGNLSREFTIKGGTTPSGDTTDPTASLSKAKINRSGDELILTIGNVNKAILTTSAAPYYKYADGEKAEQKVDYTKTILTPRTNKLAQFNVATTGLDAGKYTLVMPKGTFTYEPLDANKPVADKELTVTFEIGTSDAPTTDFSETLTNISFMNPNARNSSVIHKDVILNDLIVYAYNFDVTGLVPGTGKVKVKNATWGNTVIEGILVKYDTMAKDYGSEYKDVYALKFKPDTKIQGGELDNSPGIYGFFFEVAALGDANYAKWLANHDSVDPSICKVNPEWMPEATYFNIDNSIATGITDVKTETGSKVIYDLQGRRVLTMDKKGMYIVNGHKVVKN